MKKPYFRMKATNNDVADVFIDGEIVSDKWTDSEVSAHSFRDALKDLGPRKQINLHLNSPGGSVFDGIAINNMLKQNSANVNVYIDGLAASIASVIAMSGDTIFMPSNAMMMIHNPSSGVWGNAEEMRKMADTLDSVGEASITTYLQKAGDKLDRDTLVQLMHDETWLTAQEAVDYGLADEVIDPVEIAACVDLNSLEQYSHVPEFLLKSAKKKKPDKSDDDPNGDDEDEPDNGSNGAKKKPDKSNPDTGDGSDEGQDDGDKSNDDDKKKKKAGKKQTLEDTMLLERSAKIARQLEEIYNA